MRTMPPSSKQESNSTWTTSHLKKGSLFLTAAGTPCDSRWKTLTPEPIEVVLILLEMPLFNEAPEGVFGTNTEQACFRDVSGFEDHHIRIVLSGVGVGTGWCLVP
jgi:hypothetical protein